MRPVTHGRSGVTEVASKRGKREIERQRKDQLDGNGSGELLRDVPDARKEPLHAVKLRALLKPVGDVRAAKSGIGVCATGKIAIEVAAARAQQGRESNCLSRFLFRCWRGVERCEPKYFWGPPMISGRSRRYDKKCHRRSKRNLSQHELECLLRSYKDDTRQLLGAPVMERDIGLKYEC